MFERNIQKDQVITALKNGEIIRDYPEDKPYPSFLILHYYNKRPCI